MTFTSVAVTITKVVFDMRNYTVDSDVGTGDFSLELGMLQVCGQAHAIARVCSHGLYLHTYKRMDGLLG